MLPCLHSVTELSVLPLSLVLAWDVMSVADADVPLDVGRMEPHGAALWTDDGPAWPLDAAAPDVLLRPQPPRFVAGMARLWPPSGVRLSWSMAEAAWPIPPLCTAGLRNDSP